MVANFKLAAYGSLSGILMMSYDRVFIRGIDYTQGLRASRYEWLDTTGGSLSSILGNLLVHLAYYGIFLCVAHGYKVTKNMRYFVMLSSLVGIFGHAALNGGRSNILLAIVIFIIARVVRRAPKEIESRIVKRSRWAWLSGLIILVIAVRYVAYIIQSSADIGGVDLKTITYLGIDMLYGKETDFFHKIGGVNESLYFPIYALAYLYHGNWTSQIAFAISQRPGSYVFFPISVILNNMGILDKPLEPGYFSDVGAFISLPGAFFYDFSWVGVVVLSTLLGFLVGLSILFAGAGRVGSIKMAVILYALYMTILAPIVPGYGFAYLNFIVFAFVMADFFNSIIYGRRTCFLS
ncbi:hypothetical protein GCM10011290_09650 [Vogesella alkaliphila]|uniref:Oligosaccharide repeat unit polymerase n=2 Tax=Vogesella alkaliphila TaxID=1193621 RepID=A0ABQ2YIH5_9NEIS|nr:hypothetical protein GCM10011290_09650 [Vogesella alkaliphila]